MTLMGNRKRLAFRVLDELGGKATIHDVRSRLVDAGAIPDDAEAFYELQIEQSRDLIRQHRKARGKSGEMQLEMGHFWERDEDGRKVEYFKHLGETTAEEAAQHLRAYDSRIAELATKRAAYYEFHHQRYGEQLQRLLEFGPDDQAGIDD